MGAPLPRTVTVTDSEQLLLPGIERLRANDVEVTVVPDGTPPIEAARAAAARHGRARRHARDARGGDRRDEGGPAHHPGGHRL